ncbi:MAG: 2-iminoacetate synthase ThiH [Desulfitobacteriaceae bacterium]
MFYEHYATWHEELQNYPLASFQETDVLRALARERLEPLDLLALLSPAAEPYLETMAQKAHRLTVQNFGKTISLFTPLYLANFCSNQCVYCSFNTKNAIIRRKLELAEVETEGKAIAATGLQHLLLLTGESRQHSGPEYIQACLERLRPHFASLGIEVYPLEEDEYHRLYEAGLDALTLFQEAYDEEIYAAVHPAGPKRNYRNRLEAPERACRAGIPSINIGALLGLGEWRQEAFFTALHAEYLLKSYPGIELGISVPRLRPHAGDFQPFTSPVTDAHLVQVILAYRLYLSRAGITLSTRESPYLREALLPLGITRMSAGSLTSVGGYSGGAEAGSAQFEIADDRSVDEIVKILRTKGYHPAFVDWVNVQVRRA